MRRRLVTAIAATAAVLSLATAGASVPTEPVFVRQDVWFHQNGLKVANLEHTDLGSGKVPSWNTTKPTASVPLGAGGVYVGNNLGVVLGASTGAEHDPQHTFTAEGTATGPIDSLAVELYAYQPIGGPLGLDLGLAVDLTIDGETILTVGALVTPLEMKTENVGTGLQRVRLAITDLHEAMVDFGLDTSAEKVHSIRLNAQNFYLGNEAVFVFDSAEAPAGAVFNITPASLKDYTQIDGYAEPEPEEA